MKKNFVARMICPVGAGLQQARRVVALAIVAVLVCWSMPDGAHAAAGTLDPTFGSGGRVITDFFGVEDHGAAMVIQPDGKIIAAGTAFVDNSLLETEFALSRYNPDGSLDPSFGGGGRVTTAFVNPFAGRSGSVLALALQPDGKVIAAGTAFPGSLALARYNPNGSLDPTFGDGGKVTTHFDLGGGVSEADTPFAMAIQADGKVVTAGQRQLIDFDIFDFELVRHNPDGSLDTTFGEGGQVIVPRNVGGVSGDRSVARGVAIQADGKIVAAGDFANTQDSLGPLFDDFALVRCNADGSLDPTFGIAGQVITDFFGGTDVATSLILQPDGKLVASGLAGDSNNPRGVGLARYNSNGGLDTGFGNGGKVLSLPGAISVAGAASALQPDGKIILAGRSVFFPFSPDIGFVIARYNSNGSEDASFGNGGAILTQFPGSGSYANAVAIQADGKIVAAGTNFDSDFVGDFALARYDVTSFDICLQDDSNGNLLQFNSQTGAYQFRDCRKGLMVTGTGSIRIRSCKIELSASQPNHSITALANPCTKAGSASVKLLPAGRVLSISDRDITNNTCGCR